MFHRVSNVRWQTEVEHMGFLLQAQGRLAEAEKFFKRTLRGGLCVQKTSCSEEIPDLLKP